MKKIPQTSANEPLIRQIVKSATSIGAKYHEADNAVSRRDFRNKVGICRKEAGETKYWLRMIATAEPSLTTETRELWKEADALHRIMAKSFETSGRSLES